MKKYLLTLILSAVLMIVAVPVMAVDYVIVIVQPGDTLAKIARAFCTTWNEIYDANRASIGPNPNIISAGLALTVPNRCAAGSRPDSGGIYDRGPRTHATGTISNGVYTVAWGDTMFSISQRFGVTLTNLRTANGFAEDQDRIHAGTRLVIPGLGATGSTSPTSRSFNYGECSVQVFVGATMVDTPGGRVLQVLPAGTYTALRVSRIGNTTWYQLEYILDTTGWIVNANEGGMQELGFNGSCGLNR